MAALGANTHQGLPHDVADGNISRCSGLGYYRDAAALPGNSKGVACFGFRQRSNIQEM